MVAEGRALGTATTGSEAAGLSGTQGGDLCKRLGELLVAICPETPADHACHFSPALLETLPDPDKHARSMPTADSLTGGTLQKLYLHSEERDDTQQVKRNTEQWHGYLRRGIRGAASVCSQSRQDVAYCWCHVVSTRTGISFLIATPRNEGGGILNPLRVDGIVPVMW